MIAGLITLFVAIYLFVKGVPANFLITMIIGTFVAMALNVPTNGVSSVSFNLDELLFIPSFTAIGDISFWLSVFTLTLILIFENMGTLSSQLDMLKSPEAFQKSYRITATSSFLSGILGTSPTISSAENAAVIASRWKDRQSSDNCWYLIFGYGGIYSMDFHYSCNSNESDSNYCRILNGSKHEVLALESIFRMYPGTAHYSDDSIHL